MIESLSIAVHAFVSHVSMSFSVDETPSRKLSKLDELDTQDTAGEARTSS